MYSYKEIAICIQRLRAGGNISKCNAEEAANMLEQYILTLEKPLIKKNLDA